MITFNKDGIDVAIAGATGEVGRTMLGILEERKFPVRNLYPLASKSDNRTVEFCGTHIDVAAVADFDFSKTKLALFSMGGGPSQTFAPKAGDAGCLVVDNSSAWRQVDDVPLVVTEVNPQDLEERPRKGIVANPNCSTMQLLVALNPIHQAVGIDSFYVATYQSVSGAGAAGINELEKQVMTMLRGETPEKSKFTDVIGFNIIPHIDEFQDNGFTKEEMKIVWETHKILKDDSIKVSATAVRVPVFYGHSEAVRLVTKEHIAVKDVRKLLSDAPGISVIDDRSNGGYPTPLSHGAGNDEVFVGRIRQDLDDENALHLWVVSDNARKGAALNTVQIAEILYKNHIN